MISICVYYVYINMYILCIYKRVFNSRIFSHIGQDRNFVGGGNVENNGQNISG